MSSILKVDTIQDQSGNNIINENADTITIGASGDTITIPSGATLSSTDPLVFPAGTVSAPAITTTGDTNTGIFFPSADTIAFTEGGAEAMRINSDGNVTLTGNIGLGGATPTTSGSGITFPATASRSSNGNTLDDFEEGTWTGELRAATSATVPVTATGRYVKISGLVFVKIYFANVDTTGASGVAAITGLPFTADALQILPVMTYGQDYDDSTAVMSVQMYVENNTSAQLIATKDNAAWQATDITAGASKYFALTGTYYTTS
jgi:hypothetical protein